jgi:enamine deaminase RidA (YjgF/YER057c/UK114 family)
MTATREAIGVDEVEPYTRIVKGGGFIFVKSHIGYDPNTGEYPPDIGSQTRNTLENPDLSLHTAGVTFDEKMKVSVNLSEIDGDFDDFDAVYREFLAERGMTESPARTTIGVPSRGPNCVCKWT